MGLVLTFLRLLPLSGRPQLAEASRGWAEERGPAVVERRQEASAWRRQAAGGGLLRWRRQHIQPADIWRGGISINPYLFQPEQAFVWWKKPVLPCLRWGAPSECRCGLWGLLEGWNTSDLWLKKERWVPELDEVTPEGVLLSSVCVIIRYSHITRAQKSP